MNESIAWLEAVKADTSPGKQVVFADGSVVFDFQPSAKSQ
jgi:hypothetical protein